MSNSAVRIPLVFLGAGGFARELLGWIEHDSSWTRPIALVQDSRPVCDSSFLDIPVVAFGDIKGPVRFLLAVSTPSLKEKFVLQALALGWQPETYVSRSTAIGLEVSIGAGCVICPGSSLSTGVVVADYVTLNCRSSLGHGSSVGEYSTLLGSNQVNGDVTVADRCCLGAGSIIHPGRSVGTGATVGIGSVVITNVRDHSVVFGNPAKRVRL